jgi:ZIP family zinc transporter
MVIIIAIATFVSTLIGGLAALKLKDKLHLVLGFSAGAVIGVAFFDLIPESIILGSGYYSVSTITTIAAAGFLAYLILDRLIFLHSHSHSHVHDDHDCKNETVVHGGENNSRSILGAASLATHSFFDGAAIGLAFQVSTTIGSIVAIAVLVHDFSDGINTVGIILKSGGSFTRARAVKWLLIDAAAPVLGAASTLFFSLPERHLGIVLAVFAGFFLYIGASDLIPESHHAHPKFLTTAMTLIGAAVLYLAVHFAG